MGLFFLVGWLLKLLRRSYLSLPPWVQLTSWLLHCEACVLPPVHRAQLKGQCCPVASVVSPFLRLGPPFLLGRCACG